MTDAASEQIVAVGAGARAATAEEVSASPLAANQRLFDEAMAGIEELYSSWRNPASEPVDFPTATCTDRGAELADEAPADIADPACSSDPAPDCTEKILLRTLKQLTA